MSDNKAVEPTMEAFHAIPLQETLSRFAAQLDRRYNAKDVHPFAVLSGLPTLDQTLGEQGVRGLVGICGASGVGKSSLARQMLMATLWESKQRKSAACLLDYRTAAPHIVNRLLSVSSGVPLPLLVSGRIKDEHWPKITAALACLGGRNAASYVDPAPYHSPESFEKLAWESEGPRFLFIDHLPVAMQNASTWSALRNMTEKCDMTILVCFDGSADFSGSLRGDSGPDTLCSQFDAVFTVKCAAAKTATRMYPFDLSAAELYGSISAEVGLQISGSGTEVAVNASFFPACGRFVER